MCPVCCSRHNLGTAKKLELLDLKDFEIIQKRIMSIKVPRDIGRIPYKIESGMAGMTADQWKNWTCIYSMYVLHGLLPSETVGGSLFRHVFYFVNPSLVMLTLAKATCSLWNSANHLINYMAQIGVHRICIFTVTLQSVCVTMGQLMQLFERYNGILGSMPNNNKSLDIEKTMIKHFVQQN